MKAILTLLDRFPGQPVGVLPDYKLAAKQWFWLPVLLALLPERLRDAVLG
jgi:hypothetical protein